MQEETSTVEASLQSSHSSPATTLQVIDIISDSEKTSDFCNINQSIIWIWSNIKESWLTECQLWASWALANLTQWEESKYCPLVSREGGVEAIQGILTRSGHQEFCLSNHSKLLFSFREVAGSPSPLRDKLLLYGKMAVRNIETWKRADIGQVEAMLRD